MNAYIGHPAQISGVEEVTLAKGKGKGMTLLQIRNGKGLEITLTPDRCLDISRLTFRGDNIGFFAPSGYVAPQYYDKEGAGFLKSFTAGFMTTCGISAVGSPCVDNGEVLPLHGNISHTPCESYSYTENDQEICVVGHIRDASLFGNSYVLTRSLRISKVDNAFFFRDTVRNIGNTPAPCMLLYHINIGYPMLSENSRVTIPHKSMQARNAHAEEHIKKALSMEKPQEGYEECCYYYDVKESDGIATVGIDNPNIKKTLQISFDKSELNFFTQWKMMGIGEYVLGLEPGNCSPDGRNVMRQKGTLVELNPGDEYTCGVTVTLHEME